VWILVTGTIDFFIVVFECCKLVDVLGPLKDDDVALLVMGAVEICDVVIDGVWVVTEGLVIVVEAIVVPSAVAIDGV